MKNLENILQSIILSYENNDFKSFIKKLILLREKTALINPEIFHMDFIDFLIDTNMWNWISSVYEKDPTDFDKEASVFVYNDIKEISDNNKIFKE